MVNSALFVDMIQKTYPEIQSAFLSRYQSKPLGVRAPGRINLIGEHTDYNEGWVMPAAIDREIFFSIAHSNNELSRITTLDLNQTIEVSFTELPRQQGQTSWANYLFGVIRRLLDTGHSIEPFNCVVGSNIPAGAGMSSSAAFECGFIFGLNELNNLRIAPKEMARIAQWSENNFVGANTGIMDQYASLLGKEDKAMLVDCRSLDCEYLPLNLDQHAIVLLNSNVRHSLSDSEYNVRRKECEEGVRILNKRFPGINSLRDVTAQQLVALREEMQPKVFDRCRYVIEENDRVAMAADLLRRNNLVDFGKCMFRTHKGLSSLYEVSCPELDFLVSTAQVHNAVLGARLMGGGFGGCTINLVTSMGKDDFINCVKKAYRKSFNMDLPAYEVRTVDGCSWIQ